VATVFDEKNGGVIFLRAERNADGTRTFKLVEGEPLETGYGEDLYNQVFPVDDETTCETTRRLPLGQN
jgi:hypothetical protein